MSGTYRSKRPKGLNLKNLSKNLNLGRDHEVVGRRLLHQSIGEEFLLGVGNPPRTPCVFFAKRTFKAKKTSSKFSLCYFAIEKHVEPVPVLSTGTGTARTGTQNRFWYRFRYRYRYRY